MGEAKQTLGNILWGRAKPITAYIHVIWPWTDFNSTLRFMIQRYLL